MWADSMRFHDSMTSFPCHHFLGSGEHHGMENWLKVDGHRSSCRSPSEEPRLLLCLLKKPTHHQGYPIKVLIDLRSSCHSNGLTAPISYKTRV